MPKTYICEYCAGEIIFRYNHIYGKITPIHIDSNYLTYCPGPDSRKEERACRRTRCPKCGQEVWFVRPQNGGSIWVDELGGDWPKHSCFDEESKAIHKYPKSLIALVESRQASCLGRVIRIQNTVKRLLTYIDGNATRQIVIQSKKLPSHSCYVDVDFDSIDEVLKALREKFKYTYCIPNIPNLNTLHNALVAISDSEQECKLFTADGRSFEIRETNPKFKCPFCHRAVREDRLDKHLYFAHDLAKCWCGERFKIRGESAKCPRCSRQIKSRRIKKNQQRRH